MGRGKTSESRDVTGNPFAEPAMKKLLFQFDTDPLPAVFDNVVGYDGGADHILRLRRKSATLMSAGVHRPAVSSATTCCWTPKRIDCLVAYARGRFGKPYTRPCGGRL